MLYKMLVRPIDRDLKAEDRIQKALVIAESTNDFESIKELKSKLRSFAAPVNLKQLFFFVERKN